MGNENQSAEKPADVITKQKPPSTDSVPSGVVVSGSNQNRLKHLWGRGGKKSKVIAGCAVLALLFIAVLIFQQWSSSTTDTVDITKLQHDFSGSSIDETNEVLNKGLGVDLEYLKTHKLTAKLLKNYDGAYIAAEGLRRAGEDKKALQAFAIAERSAAKKADVMFYQEYASTALSAHDMDLWKKQMTKLREFVQASNLSKAAKEEQLNRIDIQIKLAELEK